MKKRKERIDRGIKARSEDIFALSSHLEMIYLLLPRAIPVAGLLGVAPFLSSYWREVFISTGVYALLAISWDMLISAGLISLGQSLFYGIGSYIAGALNCYWNWPPLFTIPAATLGGGLVCAFMLLPVL
jgi:branched-chain amino acid transport system permease protein